MTAFAFSQFCKLLDPQNVAERRTIPILMARESFSVPKNNKVGSYKQLVELIIGFMRHLYYHYFGVEDDRNKVFFGDAIELLRVRNLEPFYDQCRRGTNGGVGALLTKITENFCGEQEKRYIEQVIETTLEDPNDIEEIRELLTAYVQKFGRYLPYDIRSPEDLVSKWREVLLNHANVLANIRRDVGTI